MAFERNFERDSEPDMDSLRAQNYEDVPLIKMLKAGEKSSAKKIGVLTSGGDAPGMNAALRAAARVGINSGLEVYGIRRGYHGLAKGEISQLGTRDVAETIHKGGTILMTARSEEFRTTPGQIRGALMAEVYDLDAIVVIGGDGSFRGARCLARLGVPVIGIPGTIDNDISCTEYTIGYDTAMNTAVEAIDKIRDTASSHERCSVIEVMGRNAGYIAYNVGVATGAEVILVPEVPYDIEKDVVKTILEGRNKGKSNYIIVVAEGAGHATEISAQVEKATGIETRPTVLGYIQRGGSPTLRDRTTASVMGMRAVDCILSGKYNRIIVEKGGKITDVDLEEGLAMTKRMPEEHIVEAKRLF